MDNPMNKALKGIDFERAMRELPDYSPCDSPIEDIFYIQIQKYLSSECEVNRQFECKTKIGTFYLDFLIRLGERKLGFECDGKDFHDMNQDWIRDKAIIDAQLVDRIFRVRGRDIVYNLPDCFDIIREVEPTLFSQRGHLNIKQLATRDSDKYDTQHEITSGGFAVARYLTPNENTEDDHIDDHIYDHAIIISWLERAN